MKIKRSFALTLRIQCFPFVIISNTLCLEDYTAIFLAIKQKGNKVLKLI